MTDNYKWSLVRYFDPRFHMSSRRKMCVHALRSFSTNTLVATRCGVLTGFSWDMVERRRLMHKISMYSSAGFTGHCPFQLDRRWDPVEFSVIFDGGLSSLKNVDSNCLPWSVAMMLPWINALATVSAAICAMGLPPPSGRIGQITSDSTCNW